jgi:TrmH family RNA methyltransferase
LCDWFGIKQVVCSLETADLYNPKTVQATMGSMARVNVNYIDLTSYLQKNPMPIFGTFMDGENIYSSDLPEAGIIVLGNEANGISTHVEAFIQQRVSIPRFGDLQKTESLNVASAAAIVFSEFRRRSISGK